MPAQETKAVSKYRDQRMCWRVQSRVLGYGRGTVSSMLTGTHVHTRWHAYECAFAREWQVTWAPV